MNVVKTKGKQMRENIRDKKKKISKKINSVRMSTGSMGKFDGN